VGVFDQDGFAARFEWGAEGLRTLAPSVDQLVIVDVLSFSTAVEVATARGAGVIPYAFRDASASETARQKGAVLAVNRNEMSDEHPYSLSPGSLTRLPRGSVLVLPSPNGSTLTTLASRSHPVLAGCLRNARPVASWTRHKSVGVIAAGELRQDGTLRFAIEDLIGAGAILSHFPVNQRSPEAEVAVAIFQHVEHDLFHHLQECASGRELSRAGFAGDVAMAAELDVSETVPLFLSQGWYADVGSI